MKLLGAFALTVILITIFTMPHCNGDAYDEVIIGRHLFSVAMGTAILFAVGIAVVLVRARISGRCVEIGSS